MEMTRAWLLLDPTLTALRAATERPPVPGLAVNNHDLPSWAPSIDEMYPFWYYEPQSRLPHVLEDSQSSTVLSGRHLHIQGAIVDSVDFVWKDDPLPDTGHPRRIWQKWPNWTSELECILPYSTGEPLMVTLWRTLFQDVEHKINAGDSQQIKHLENWSR